MTESERLISHILSLSSDVVELQSRLTEFRAFSPAYGGNGEWEKSRYILDNLPPADITEINSLDDANGNIIRPNIVAFFKGASRRTLWLFAHLDVVPAGDLQLWDNDPWQVRQDGDLLYGRGVEDNQQAVVSMLVLAKSLYELNIVPACNLGLVFMADEETGSSLGLKRILEQHPALFRGSDFFIVPDGGSPSANEIEIAEKAQLWLKFVVQGRQCHASMPDKGSNALVAASALILQLARLNSYFNIFNPLFAPPISTFAPTKHEANVEAINIIPGRETFYLDCRLLPELSLEIVLQRIHAICESMEKLHNVKIETEICQYQQASSVNADTPVIKLLGRAIKKIYHEEIKLIGIGGASVAAFLRDKGLPAVVWSCLKNTCHQPNECSSISAALKDAAVFANILMEEGSSGNG